MLETYFSAGLEGVYQLGQSSVQILAVRLHPNQQKKSFYHCSFKIVMFVP